MYIYVQRFNHKNLYFSSDFHGRHDKDFIYVPRGFSSSDEHDKKIRQDFRELPNDSVLFLLGDTVFGNDGLAYWEHFLKDVGSSDIFIMPGNHFSGLNDLYRKYGRQFSLMGFNGINKNIALIQNLYEIEVCGQFVVLSHYPIISWNKMGKGAYHLFGHVHSRIKEGLPNGTGFGKMLDVGIDSVGKPISFKEIELIMSKKPFSKIDHHGE